MNANDDLRITSSETADDLFATVLSTYVQYMILPRNHKSARLTTEMPGSTMDGHHD